MNRQPGNQGGLVDRVFGHLAVGGPLAAGDGHEARSRVGEDRVVAFDMPGTTRDSIFVPFERNGKPYTLIDTAGVRRRKNIKEKIEKEFKIKPTPANEALKKVIEKL